MGLTVGTMSLTARPEPGDGGWNRPENPWRGSRERGSESLEHAVRDRILRSRSRHGPVVESFDHQGNRYFVKHAKRERPRYLRSWFLSLGCALVFGEFVRPARLRSGGLEHEARRLQEWRAQGVRVPRVHFQSGEFLVLEDCGRPLPEVLEAASPAEREAFLERIVAELASFHRAGHWHGGAQIRNLTFARGQIWRIDFEEAAGNALPLPLMQAYDLVLCLHSMLDHLDGDVGQGARLIDAYFRKTRSVKVAGAFSRIGRIAGFLLLFEPWLGAMESRHRDVRRTLQLVRLLQGRNSLQLVS